MGTITLRSVSSQAATVSSQQLVSGRTRPGTAHRCIASSSRRGALPACARLPVGPSRKRTVMVRAEGMDSDPELELASSLSTAAATAEEAWMTHSVSRGETFETVALKYGTTVDKLMENNWDWEPWLEIRDPRRSQLPFGRTIQVPAAGHEMPSAPPTTPLADAEAEAKAKAYVDADEDFEELAATVQKLHEENEQLIREVKKLPVGESLSLTADASHSHSEQPVLPECYMEDGWMIHRTTRGETFEIVALRYETTVDKLCEANQDWAPWLEVRDVSRSQLPEGHTIQVPSPQAAEQVAPSEPSPPSPPSESRSSTADEELELASDNLKIAMQRIQTLQTTVESQKEVIGMLQTQLAKHMENEAELVKEKAKLKVEQEQMVAQHAKLRPDEKQMSRLASKEAEAVLTSPKEPKLPKIPIAVLATNLEQWRAIHEEVKPLVQKRKDTAAELVAHKEGVIQRQAMLEVWTVELGRLQSQREEMLASYKEKLLRLQSDQDSTWEQVRDTVMMQSSDMAEIDGTLASYKEMMNTMKPKLVEKLESETALIAEKEEALERYAGEIETLQAAMQELRQRRHSYVAPGAGHPRSGSPTRESRTMCTLLSNPKEDPMYAVPMDDPSRRRREKLKERMHRLEQEMNQAVGRP